MAELHLVNLRTDSSGDIAHEVIDKAGLVSVCCGLHETIFVRRCAGGLGPRGRGFPNQTIEKPLVCEALPSGEVITMTLPSSSQGTAVFWPSAAGIGFPPVPWLLGALLSSRQVVLTNWRRVSYFDLVPSLQR